MLSRQRNVFELNGWVLSQVEDFGCLCNFDCGESDLNDFFREDCISHKQDLLSETFSLYEKSDPLCLPVALISLCNDAVRKEKIFDWLNITNPKKVYPSYPAVKIARFGVQQRFQRKSLGTHVINMVKTMFITNNRTGCRLITLDAYNDRSVLNFYQNNHFQFFSDKDAKKENRAMFFDLLRLTL